MVTRKGKIVYPLVGGGGFANTLVCEAWERQLQLKLRNERDETPFHIGWRLATAILMPTSVDYADAAQTPPVWQIST